MVGIKDIAKKAGVSISTVSYALNGSPKVTEKTRKRIMTIANELNYIPNMAARTLKNKRNKNYRRLFNELRRDFLRDFTGRFNANAI